CARPPGVFTAIWEW
nr:immunoglobulin heavy chain junction region [Macaca mulatta]